MIYVCMHPKLWLTIKEAGMRYIRCPDCAKTLVLCTDSSDPVEMIREAFGEAWARVAQRADIKGDQHG
jgi:hypothetical protein